MMQYKEPKYDDKKLLQILVLGGAYMSGLHNRLQKEFKDKKYAEAFDVTLKVSFESFSIRINDIDNFNRESLERLSRMDDLSFSEQAELKGLAAANQSILIVNRIITSKMSSTPQIHTTAD